MRALGLKAMPLGLDLRGGLYLLYQVDVGSAITQLLGSYEQSFRRALQDAKLPLTDVQTIATTGSATPNGDSFAAGRRHGRRASRAHQGRQYLELQHLERTNSSHRHGADARADRGTRGLRARAESDDAQQPRQRAGCVRTDRAAPGTGSHRGGAAGRERTPPRSICSARLRRSSFTYTDETNNPFQAQQSGQVPLGDKLYKMQQDATPILLKREVIAIRN